MFQEIPNVLGQVRKVGEVGNGKIEAFHKAYVYEGWMFPSHQGLIRYWNYERPHQGIR